MARETVLVLGGSGLLGHHCCGLFERDYNVIKTYKNNPIAGPDSFKLDAFEAKNSLVRLIKETKPVLIINTIAYVTVDGCETNRRTAECLNVKFVKDLVAAMAFAGASSTHLIHISSDSIYGQRSSDLPWVEEDCKAPLSVYASTKLNSESMALDHTGPTTVLRTAFYGINPYADTGLLSWILIEANKRNTIDGWDNIFFSPVSAEQLAVGIKNIFERSVTGIFNAGSSDACNKYEFCTAVCDFLHIDANINRVTSNNVEVMSIRPTYTVLDSGRLGRLIPWSIRWRDDLLGYLGQL
jgi:dTDP-4-dehydrorhamnose reductase